MDSELKGMPMSAILEVVIPVLMPSTYLSQIREHLKDACDQIKIIFVLDYINGNAENEVNFSDQSPREVFVCGSFGSPGSARNAGLEICTSEYVCFWDSDDLPHLENVCRSVKNLMNLNLEIAIGKWNLVQNENSLRGTKPLDTGLNPGIWRCIFNRRAIGNTRFTNLMWGEDQVFLAQFLARTKQVLTVDEVLYSYRPNSVDSLTSKKSHVKDLCQASKICQGVLSNATNSNLLVTAAMLLRQSITMMKFGNLSIKICGLNVLAVTSVVFLKKVNFRTFLSTSFEWKNQ
jgi:glycosyltransferase involved in cell wall biosynthesis